MRPERSPMAATRPSAAAPQPAPSQPIPSPAAPSPAAASLSADKAPVDASQSRSTGPEQAQRWVILTPDDAVVDRLAATLNVPPLVARVLVNRGLDSEESARSWMAPSLATLPDPYLMADAECAAERVAAAIVTSERICIYGDYDVDGISASALLYTFLSDLGVKARVFLPDRFRDGYGLNAARLAELCDDGVDLFISVDCGSNAAGPIGDVVTRGADFVVCDHHQLGDDLPPAHAVMNPRRLDCNYPDKTLSAVGVALVLAQAVRRKLAAKQRFAGKPPALAPLLQFAALGTIADVVPLKDVNRLIVWHGLKRLSRSRAPGVVALRQRTNLKRVGRADHVGFVLGPRINAAGRVADAHTAFELLTTADHDKAKALAERVDLENTRRRAIQNDVELEALAAAAHQEHNEQAVVVAQEGWHAGVVGIVAARVRESMGSPTFVLSIEGDVARGSGRSIGGYDLVAGLRAVDDGTMFTRYGGHHYAAGVTLPAENVDRFRAALIEHVRATVSAADRVETLRIDAEVDVRAIDLPIIDALDELEPYGRGNPRPKFLLRAVTVADKRLLGDGKWARIRLVEGGDRPLWARRGVAVFTSAAMLEGLVDGDVVSAVVQLQRNTFRGETTPQLRPLAFGPPDPVLEAVSQAPDN